MDIVERLNKWLWAGSPWVDTMGGAASEITRLREENKAMREALERIAAFHPKTKSDPIDAQYVIGWNSAGDYASAIARTALATTGGE